MAQKASDLHSSARDDIEAFGRAISLQAAARAARYGSRAAPHTICHSTGKARARFSYSLVQFGNGVGGWRPRLCLHHVPYDGRASAASIATIKAPRPRGQRKAPHRDRGEVCGRRLRSPRTPPTAVHRRPLSQRSSEVRQRPPTPLCLLKTRSGSIHGEVLRGSASRQ